MSFEMELLPEARLARVTARGRIDFDTSIAAMRELASRPGYQPRFGVLADFRGVSYSPSLSDLRGFLAAFKEIRSSYQGRLALVVDGKLHTALAKTACALGRLVRFEMRCFHDPELAGAWLGTAQ
jgi:hypothetical protein